MGDSKMIALITKTMENYEDRLVKKLVMAGRFSAMCSSKTSTKSGRGNDVYYKGVAFGIMKYNQIVNDLICLRIIKELMSALKMGKFSKTSKVGKTSKYIRKFAGRIGRMTKKSMHNKSVKFMGRGGAQGEQAGDPTSPDVPGRSRPTTRWTTTTTRRRSRSPGRSRSPARRRDTGARIGDSRTKTGKMGPGAIYIAAFFGLVLFLIALAMMAFGGGDGDGVKAPPFTRPGDTSTILNVQMGEETFENAYRWVSGRNDCGVFAFSHRTQEEHDRSKSAYQGRATADACLSKSSLQGQSDAFSRDFIPYANELIINQRDICRDIFNSGFKSYIASSKIWNSGRSIRVTGMDDTKIGVQWQQDVISKLCDDVGSFSFKKIDGNDKLTITIVDPRSQNHYIDEFTQLLNELSDEGHITKGDASDFLSTIRELREFPDLTVMAHDKISSRVISDDLPLGDKLNGVSQLLINYNSQVSKWDEAHKTMLSDGYKEWNMKKVIVRTDGIHKTKKLAITQNSEAWKLSIEEVLGPLTAITESATSTVVEGGIKITTNGVGAVAGGIADTGTSLFTLFEKLAFNGVTASIISFILFMIYKQVGGMVLRRILNTVLEKIGMRPAAAINDVGQADALGADDQALQAPPSTRGRRGNNN